MGQILPRGAMAGLTAPSDGIGPTVVLAELVAFEHLGQVSVARNKADVIVLQAPLDNMLWTRDTAGWAGFVTARVTELWMPPRWPVTLEPGMFTIFSWAWYMKIVPSLILWETTARATSAPLVL